MRRKCRSLRMIEWSRHSRLTLPIRRSTYGFCHGLRGAVTTSSTPIAVTVERNDCPYAPSRSRIRYRGAVPHGNASRICCATHAIVGFAVTPKCTIWRRSWWSTMNPNRRWNVAVGTTKTIDRRQAIGVICKECPPRLRWRRWVTDHVFRDGGLGDGKAKLQKARHGSEVRPTVCSPATSVGPDSGSPSTPVVGPAFPAATSMSGKA